MAKQKRYSPEQITRILKQQEPGLDRHPRTGRDRDLRLMSQTHLVLHASGNRVSKIIKVFVFHFFCQCHQGFDRFAHFRYLFVAAATTFAVGAFISAFAVAWDKFHYVFPYWVSCVAGGQFVFVIR